MFEMIGGGIFGSLLGGVFRLAPEVLKWMDFFFFQAEDGIRDVMA